MNHEPCPHRLIELIRWHMGELPAPEAHRIETQIASCTGCQTRVDALKADKERFLKSVHSGAQSAAILARLEAPPKAPWWKGWRAPALAAGLAVLALAPMAILGGDGNEPTQMTRTKGSPVLEMFVNTPNGARPATDGIHLSAGDQVQFRYKAAGRPYLWVLSVDSSHAITPLYPEHPGQSLPIEPQGTHVLEGSIILDDAQGPERVYAIFSKEPLSFSELERAAQQQLEQKGVAAMARLLDTHPPDEQVSVLIVKE